MEGEVVRANEKKIVVVGQGMTGQLTKSEKIWGESI